jgi:hypothetical protein
MLEGREGRPYLEEGLKVARFVDDRPVLGLLLLHAAWPAWLEGDLKTYDQLTVEALQVAEEVGSDRLIGWALERRASTVGLDIEERRTLFKRALRHLRVAGDRWLEMATLSNQATSEAEHDCFETARTLLDDALRMAEELANQREKSIHLQTLGMVAVRQRHPQSARVVMTESLQIALRIGWRLGIAYCLLCWAATAPLLDRVEEGVILHGAADALYERLGCTPEPFDAKVRDASLLELHESMGIAFEAAYTTGRQLELDAAVDLAFTL